MIAQKQNRPSQKPPEPIQIPLPNAFPSPNAMMIHFPNTDPTVLTVYSPLRFYS